MTIIDEIGELSQLCENYLTDWEAGNRQNLTQRYTDIMKNLIRLQDDPRFRYIALFIKSQMIVIGTHILKNRETN